MVRGSLGVETKNPYTLGTVTLQEPNAGGGATTGAAAAATLQVRGTAYLPKDKPGPAPVIVLVHGNHTQCDSGTSPNCTAFKRNDLGYGYLGENLASWGYAVFSVDQDQMMAFQDGLARGMHQRRLLIAATLDALYKANQEPLPEGPNSNVGADLVGRLDFSRIGLMGHSRGGDAVTSFIDYNRSRPSPGRRYPLRAVISLAGTDYERRAPYGVPYLAHLPLCDGDVSNLHAARNFERGQYIFPGDPFPRVQFAIHGTNHNWYNSVWDFDGEDSNTGDQACTITAPTTSPNHVRLSRGTYDSANRGSGDPARMGDQARIGLATMSSFFRRYVGGEVDFEPFITGETQEDGTTPVVPASACPQGGTTNATSGGTRIPCVERMLTSYFPGAGERRDVLDPDPDDPLTVSAVGTSITASGFANPYVSGGGVTPQPATTATGIDWCNPDPKNFSDTALGGPTPNLPQGDKPCPVPAIGALGGQSGMRENSPVNNSYGLQLAVAWDNPLGTGGAPATLATRIPQAAGDVRGFKALALAAAVNFFDPRNPDRTLGDGAALWNPAASTQDFTIALTDAAGRTATVSAADPRFGNALHPTVGSTTSKVHILLNEIRVPLSVFAGQGLDLGAVRRLELRFGEAGKPATGSIQLADVRFQEATTGSPVFAETTRNGPASGPTRGPDPMAIIDATQRVSTAVAGDVIGLFGATTVRTGAACTDRVAPSLALGRIAVTGGRLTLRGTARDRGCRSTAPRTVLVSLTRAAGAGRCRFVTPSGRLSRVLPCGLASSFVATGTRSFRLKLARRLGAGRYTVTVRALDAAGNVAARTARVTVR
ncbi:alpha/beta hydrolase [Paraconexibacter algicola]|uniref:Alpha/beta hydrolase n=2 Tax=Paraconexibacter algicola TaxID=2133960 RepID=A0A2T4UFW2_9ACTN|nr:alpha/beta hydrolase [Paraconexibacter algicola]